MRIDLHDPRPIITLASAAVVFAGGYTLAAMGALDSATQPTGVSPTVVTFAWQTLYPCLAAILLWHAASQKGSPLRWVCVGFGAAVFVFELLNFLTTALPGHPFSALWDAMPFFQFALLPWVFGVLFITIAAEPHATSKLPASLAWGARGIGAAAVLVVALAPSADKVPMVLKFIPLLAWALHHMASWVYFGSVLGFYSLGVTNWIAMALIDLSFVYFTYWLIARITIAWAMARRNSSTAVDPTAAVEPT